MLICLVEKIKKISTLSDQDYLDICSTFITMTEPKYRCSDCKLKYKSDQAKLKKNLEFMACDYIPDKPRHFYKPEFNNQGNPVINYKNCIGNYYNNFFASMINYYPKYKDGILPFAGGMYDQPSKFVDLMDLVHNLISENNESNRQKQQLLAKRRNGTR